MIELFTAWSSFYPYPAIQSFTSFLQGSEDSTQLASRRSVGQRSGIEKSRASKNSKARALTFDSRTNSDVDNGEEAVDDDAKPVCGPTTRRQWSEIISKSGPSKNSKRTKSSDADDKVSLPTDRSNERAVVS